MQLHWSEHRKKLQQIKEKVLFKKTAARAMIELHLHDPYYFDY